MQIVGDLCVHLGHLSHQDAEKQIVGDIYADWSGEEVEGREMHISQGLFIIILLIWYFFRKLRPIGDGFHHTKIPKPKILTYI